MDPYRSAKDKKIEELLGEVQSLRSKLQEAERREAALKKILKETKASFQDWKEKICMKIREMQREFNDRMNSLRELVMVGHEADGG